MLLKYLKKESFFKQDLQNYYDSVFTNLQLHLFVVTTFVRR